MNRIKEIISDLIKLAKLKRVKTVGDFIRTKGNGELAAMLVVEDKRLLKQLSDKGTHFAYDDTELYDFHLKFINAIISKEDTRDA